MSIEIARGFFLSCTVINYGILLVWFLALLFARDGIQRFHGRWFRLSGEQLSVTHYAGMAVFKVGIMLFNLVPYISLCVVG
jgi:hypothetical protein